MPEAAPPPSSFADLSLAEIAAWAESQALPPVERWTPAHCGDSTMRIARDGTWYHEGAPIQRPAMVRLFAGLLRREGESYALVTPVEKLTIAVDDLPFVATELKSEGAGPDRRIAFRLNTDELVIAGSTHPITFAPDGPRLVVRPGLDARLTRPVYYELVELALDESNAPLGLWSDGAFFAVEPE
jgi:uncharacterized protein